MPFGVTGEGADTLAGDFTIARPTFNTEGVVGVAVRDVF